MKQIFSLTICRMARASALALAGLGGLARPARLQRRAGCAGIGLRAARWQQIDDGGPQGKSDLRQLLGHQLHQLCRGNAQTYFNLQQIQEPGYDTLAVAMSYDRPGYVVHYTQTRALPFKVALDNTGAVAKAWDDVQLTPTTYLVNKRGQIVKKYVGEPDWPALHQLIEKLLTES